MDILHIILTSLSFNCCVVHLTKLMGYRQMSQLVCLTISAVLPSVPSPQKWQPLGGLCHASRGCHDRLRPGRHTAIHPV